MRTTVAVDDELLAAARRLAADERRTLGSVVEDALREMLNRRQDAPRAPLRLTTVGGGGLMPGVDLDDSAALADLLDGLGPDP